MSTVQSYPNAKEIEDLLKQVKYPGFSRDIVSFGIVHAVDARGPEATIELEFSTSNVEISGKVKADVVELLKANGLEQVEVIIEHKNPQETKSEEQEEKENLIPSVKHVVAVASGKGGVGKSTVAANLAVALGKNGQKVGLLDADIHGPSVGVLLGLSDEPEKSPSADKLMPMTAHGIKAMSMGVLVDSDTPLVWRGPMVSGAVQQLIKDVDWGDLDVLVLDMPPGTGDIQLTVAQSVKLDGAVIVTTPQKLARIDARKGIAMFQKVEVPVLGVIENMSYFLAPDTGKRYDIFSTGGARREALRQRVPFIGEIPLVPVIREGSDEGNPPAAEDGPVGEIFKEMAKNIWTMLTRDDD